jgi:hypothetical protein
MRSKQEYFYICKKNQMNTAAIKVDLAKKILDTNDKNLINYFKAIFDTHANWADELPDEVRASFEKGLRQSAKGETVSHSDVRKKYQKWLKK